MANCFGPSTKKSAIGDLLKRDDCPAAGHVLDARLLIRAGEYGGAAQQYREAIALDPSLSDSELARMLGDQSHDSGGDEDDFDGREPLRADDHQEPDPPDAELERPTATFSEVGGMRASRMRFD